MGLAVCMGHRREENRVFSLDLLSPPGKWAESATELGMEPWSWTQRRGGAPRAEACPPASLAYFLCWWAWLAGFPEIICWSLGAELTR